MVKLCADSSKSSQEFDGGGGDIPLSVGTCSGNFDKSVQKEAISEVEVGEFEERNRDGFGISNKQVLQSTVLVKRPLAFGEVDCLVTAVKKSKTADSESSIKTELVSGKSEQNVVDDDDSGDIPFCHRIKKPVKSIGCTLSVEEAKKLKESGDGSEYSLLSGETDLNEKELALVRCSIEECQMKRQVEEQRLHSLEKDIEERTKEVEYMKKQVDFVRGELSSYYRDVEEKKREYRAIQRSIQKCSREFEANEEKLKSTQKLISECDSHLRLKKEQCIKELEMVQTVINARKQISEKMTREEYDMDLEEKKAHLSKMEDLIRDCEQKLKTRQIEFRQVLNVIDRDCERKEGQLRALLKKIAECTKKLHTKEVELDAMQKLISGQAEELQLEEEQLGERVKEFKLKKKEFECQEEELESNKKHFDSKLKKLQSEEKQLEGRVEELKSKELKIEVQEKELESKEKQVEGQAKELQCKEKQFEMQLKELKSKQQQFEGEVKDLQAKKNQFEGQLKVFEFEKKQYEALKESLEEEKLQDSQSRLLGHGILAYLQSSEDPAKLILDTLRDPIVQQCEKGDKVVTFDISRIFLLEQVMRISPHIKPHVREEAMNQALELKANMRSCTENSLEVLGFLMILSIYGLVSCFNEDEVLQLFEIAARHKQAVVLFRILGFADKISDFVGNLIKKQQYVEAVMFICACNLADTTQPVDLLREHVRKAKLICESSCNETKSIGMEVIAIDEKIAGLGTVLHCISDNNIEECQDLVKEIQDRILELKTIKENKADAGQNDDEAGPSANSTRHFIDEQNNESDEDQRSMEDDIDSDKDSEVLEDNIYSDNSGDENMPETATNLEPQSHPPYMHVVHLEAMRPPEFVHFEEEELCLGMEFDDIDQVKHAIKRYSLKRSVDFKVHESHRMTYYCKCKKTAEGCPWLIRVSLTKKADTWVVTKYRGKHSCIVQDKASDHPKLDSDMIAKEIEVMVQSDPSLKIKNVQADMLKIFGFRPSYSKAWMAKQKAVARWFGNWEESYAELPKLLTALEKVDRDARFQLQTFNVYNDGQLLSKIRMFRRLFWTFGPLVKAFEYCKSIIEVDGMHLYGQYKGTLLIACSQDGNNNTVAIAFAIVEDETTDAWEFFFDNLRRYIVTTREVAIISDHHASILAAMERIGDQWAVSHLFCLKHIAVNFNHKFKQKFLGGQVMNIGNSTTITEFERRYERMRGRNVEYTNWLDQMPLEKWVCAYNGGRRYGQMTMNIAECMNNVYKGVCNLPITSLVETSYFRSVTLFVRKSMETSTRLADGQLYSDSISTTLEGIRKASLGLEVTLFSREQLSFHVREPQTMKSFHVNLSAWYCECGQFQTMRYPCRHVLAACASVSHDWTMYVDKVYTNASVYKVYEKEFGVIGHKNLWPRYRGPKVVPNLDLRRNVRGRPKLTRF